MLDSSQVACDGVNAGIFDFSGPSGILDVGDAAVGTPLSQLRQRPISTAGLAIEGPGTIEVGVFGDTELQLPGVFPGGLQKQDDFA